MRIRILDNKIRWDYIEPDTEVIIPHMSVCKGCIVRGDVNGGAYAGHFTLAEDCGFEKMMEKSFERLGNPGSLEFYAFGGSLVPEEIYKLLMRPFSGSGKEIPPSADIWKTQLEDRKYVENLIKKYRFKKNKVWIRWSPLDSITHLIFDTNNFYNKLKIENGKKGTIYEGDIRNAPKFNDNSSILY